MQGNINSYKIYNFNLLKNFKLIFNTNYLFIKDSVTVFMLNKGYTEHELNKDTFLN